MQINGRMVVLIIMTLILAREIGPHIPRICDVIEKAIENRYGFKTDSVIVEPQAQPDPKSMPPQPVNSPVAKPNSKPAQVSSTKPQQPPAAICPPAPAPVININQHQAPTQVQTQAPPSATETLGQPKPREETE